MNRMIQAHRRTHNKTPSDRKNRKKRPEKTAATFEVVEMIKEEELELYDDETYEEEFITD